MAANVSLGAELIASSCSFRLMQAPLSTRIEERPELQSTKWGAEADAGKGEELLLCRAPIGAERARILPPSCPAGRAELRFRCSVRPSVHSKNVVTGRSCTRRVPEPTGTLFWNRGFPSTYSKSHSMFLQYYGFHEQPFGFTPNPRYLFPSGSCREAHASVLYGIENNVGFSALIADPGMGKTTLLFSVLERLRGTARTAFVFTTQDSSRDLLRYINLEFDLPDCGDDPVRFHEQFKELLLAEARRDRPVILLLDEAQNLDEASLEAIRLLSDFETPGKKLLQVVLAGQPQFGEKLARPALSQLTQRITTVSRLAKLNPNETSAYITHHISKAGYCGNQLFTPDALAWIAEKAHGIPREINRLCFNGLSIGCALRKRTVDVAVLTEVEQDLDLCPVSEHRIATNRDAAASTSTRCSHDRGGFADAFVGPAHAGNESDSTVTVTAASRPNHSLFSDMQWGPNSERRSRGRSAFHQPERVNTAREAAMTADSHSAADPQCVSEKSSSKLVSTALKLTIAAVILVEIAVAIVLMGGGAPATLQIIYRVREQFRTLVNDRNDSSTTSFRSQRCEGAVLLAASY
jgi:type II secretory pathway predicted ATPase ExeA